MNLKTLLLRGFLSWKEETTIHFQEGLTLITARNLDDPDHAASMGGGKSSLLYAICWALWGKVPPGGGVADVINHESDAAYVELTLQGDTLFKINRYKPVRGSQNLEYWYGTQHIKGDYPYVQDLLQKAHGISWEVFCNTIFTSPLSEVQQFVTATPGKRAALLGELVNDNAFQEAAKKLTAQISELDKSVTKLTASRQEQQRQEAQLKADIERLRVQINDQHIIQQRAERAVAEKTAAMQTEMLQLQEVLKQSPVSETNLIAQQNANRETMANLERESLQHHYVLGRVLPGAGYTCPTCEQPISTELVNNLEAEKQVARTEIARITRELAVQKSVQHELADQRGKLTLFQQNQAMATKRIDDLKIQAMQLRDTLENKAIVVLHQELERARQRLQETMQLMAERDREIAAAGEKIPVLKTLRNGFANEIRNMMLDEMRQVLAHYTSLYVQHLAGNEFSIEFPPTSETGKEKFEIVIRSGGKINPLTSGGETYRAQFAVLLALRRALTFGQSCSYRFMLIDDPLSQLDDTGIQAFFSLLRAVLPDFPTILITVPRDLNAEVDHRVCVERRHRVSSLVGSQ